MATRPDLTTQVRREIAAAYSSDEPLAEIYRAYGIGTGTLYRILNELGIPRRKSKHGEPLVLQPTDTVVSTDAALVVTKVSHRPAISPHASEWEIHYTGILTISAESIDQALAEARKVASVRRVYQIKLLSRADR